MIAALTCCHLWVDAAKWKQCFCLAFMASAGNCPSTVLGMHFLRIVYFCACAPHVDVVNLKETLVF